MAATVHFIVICKNTSTVQHDGSSASSTLKADQVSRRRDAYKSNEYDSASVDVDIF